MIALEAKYQKCLPKLYNRTRAVDSTAADLDVDANLHGIALAELVTYMEDFCLEECVIPIFKLSVALMYKVCLAQLGTDIEGHIHNTRLKIGVSPDLRPHLQWRDVLIP